MAAKKKTVSLSLPLPLAERLTAFGNVSATATLELEMMAAVRDYGLRSARRVLTDGDMEMIARAMQGVFFDASQVPVWLSGNGLAHQVDDALGPHGDLAGIPDGASLVETISGLGTLEQLAVIMWAVGKGRL